MRNGCGGDESNIPKPDISSASFFGCGFKRSLAKGLKPPDTVEKLHYWLNIKNFRAVQKSLHFLSEGVAKI